MDPFHRRIAATALAAADQYGFCLAGGYAVVAHGFVDRLSEDVDLFSTMAAERDFPDAVQAVTVALKAAGLAVELSRQGSTFARLVVSDPVNGATSNLELGLDWRAYPPARMAIGPVLHADDAVANKVCALFSRAEVRDYVDVDGVLRSGRYELGELLRMAAEHDPGFDPGMFAEALAAARRLADSALARYGLTEAEADALRGRLVAWSARITAGT